MSWIQKNLARTNQNVCLPFYYPILELRRPSCFPHTFCVWCKLNFGPQYGSGKLQQQIFKEQVYFCCCLIFLPTTTSHPLKKNNFHSQNLNHQNLFSLFKSHLVVQISRVECVKYFVNSQEINFVQHFFQNIPILHTVTPFTVNSFTDILLQIL